MRFPAVAHDLLVATTPGADHENRPAHIWAQPPHSDIAAHRGQVESLGIVRVGRDEVALKLRARLDPVQAAVAAECQLATELERAFRRARAINDQVKSG